MTAKILTVDDSASIRMTTRVAPASAGYTVTEAVDGMDGLNKLQSSECDLVESRCKRTIFYVYRKYSKFTGERI